jgi:hypothetical protein
MQLPPDPKELKIWSLYSPETFVVRMILIYKDDGRKARGQTGRPPDLKSGLWGRIR